MGIEGWLLIYIFMEMARTKLKLKVRGGALIIVERSGRADLMGHLGISCSIVLVVVPAIRRSRPDAGMCSARHSTIEMGLML